MFSSRTSPSKWVTEPAFDVGTLAASPSTKMFGAASDCRVCGIGRDEVQLVAQAGRAGDEVGAAVDRHGDEEIERHLALVVGDEATTGAVDLTGVELGDEIDLLLGEQPAERLRRDRLRERARRAE